jgi:hypothetical protein
MNEELAAQDYLRTYLEADSTLMAALGSGVYLRTTPGTARFPVVKIDRLDADDVYPIGLNRIWADLTFLVRGIVHWRGSGVPDWTEVRTIGDRLETLLHDHEETTAELEVHSFREEPFSDETVEAGDLFLHGGGIYRVRARAV